jgi:hypothetical protein
MAKLGNLRKVAEPVESDEDTAPPHGDAPSES